MREGGGGGEDLRNTIEFFFKRSVPLLASL